MTAITVTAGADGLIVGDIHPPDRPHRCGGALIPKSRVMGQRATSVENQNGHCPVRVSPKTTKGQNTIYDQRFPLERVFIVLKVLAAQGPQVDWKNRPPFPKQRCTVLYPMKNWG